MSVHKCSRVILSVHEYSLDILSVQVLDSANKQKMPIFKITSFKYFGDLSVNISPNDNKLHNFKTYMERTVEKCWWSKFLVQYGLRNCHIKRTMSFAGDPLECRMQCKVWHREQSLILKIQDVILILIIYICSCSIYY